MNFDEGKQVDESTHVAVQHELDFKGPYPVEKHVCRALEVTD
jgi:hypothetical protein